MSKQEASVWYRGKGVSLVDFLKKNFTPICWLLCIVLIFIRCYSILVLKQGFSIQNPDNLQVVFPFFAFFLESINLSGLIDPWNPNIWGGTPAIGNPNVPLNPLLFLMFFLSKEGLIYALNIHIVVEVVAACVGMFTLIRFLLKDNFLATFGALSYVLSISTAHLSGFFGTLLQCATLPWTVYLCLSSDRRSFFRNIALITAIFYYQITYNQLQMLLYSLYFLGFSLLVFSPKEKILSHVKVLGVAGVISILLSTHHWLPIADFLALYKDRQNIDLMEYARITSVPIQYFFHFFSPELFYTPKWWPIWHDGWTPWESYYAYAGSLLSVCLFAGVLHLLVTGWRNLDSKGLIINWFVAAVVILTILNSTTVGSYLLLKLSGGTAVPSGRVTVFFPYLTTFIAVFLFAKAFANCRLSKVLMVVSCLFSAGITFLYSQAHILKPFIISFFAEAQKIYAVDLSEDQEKIISSLSTIQGLLHRNSSLYAWLALLLVAGFMFYNLKKYKVLAYLSLGLAGVISLTDAYKVQRLVQPLDNSPRYPYADQLSNNTSVIRFLQNNLDKERYFAATALVRRDNSGLTPNQNSIYGIPLINGYTSVVPLDSELIPKFSRANFWYVYPYNLQQLASVKYLVTSKETRKRNIDNLEHGLSEAMRSGELIVHKFDQALPKYYFPQEVVKIEKDEFKEIFDTELLDFATRSYVYDGPEVYSRGDCQPSYKIVGKDRSNRVLSIDNPCTVAVNFALNSSSHHWWKYKINGKEVEARSINGLHKMLLIEPGKHEVEISCIPTIWHIGLGISGLTLVCLVWLGLWLRRKFREEEKVLDYKVEASAS